MDQQHFTQLCEAGEKAENLIDSGRTREALSELMTLVKSLETTGEGDSYLCAKTTLAVLRCHVKLGNFKAAFEVWNADMDRSIYGIGIYALESAQTTVKDMVTYDMLCAFLHTLTDAPNKTTSQAVNQYLSRVCEQALDDGDRNLMRAAISNWKQHLREIYRGTLPMEAAAPLILFEKQFGETVKPEPINFPKPAPWNRPSDFLEMSRFANLRKTRKRRAS